MQRSKVQYKKETGESKRRKEKQKNKTNEHDI